MENNNKEIDSKFLLSISLLLIVFFASSFYILNIEWKKENEAIFSEGKVLYCTDSNVEISKNTYILNDQDYFVSKKDKNIKFYTIKCDENKIKKSKPIY